MKIDLNDLRSGLAIAGRAVATRTTLPILAHILLRARGGELELTGNNLEIAITTSVGAMVEEDFGITVPAKLFTDYIAALGDGEIEMTVDEKTMTLTVKAVDNEGTVRGMSPQDFPMLPVVEGETIEFAPADLLEAIDMVAFAACTDEARIVLTGVLVNLFGKKIIMTTADGFRASKYERIIETADEESAATLLVPARALIELAKVIQHPEDVVKMKVGKERLAFEVGPTTLTCGLIDGVYPDVNQIIPEENKATTTMVIDRREFLAMVKAATVFAKFAHELLILKIVTLGAEEKSGTASIAGMAAELGDNMGKCDAEVMGENLEIAFNAKYLAEVLSALKTDKVNFFFTAPSAPAMIRQDGFTHVIMPMALSG